MVSRCFPGGYNVKLYISRGRLAWWLLAFLCCVTQQDLSLLCIVQFWPCQSNRGPCGLLSRGHGIQIPVQLNFGCILGCVLEQKILLLFTVFMSHLTVVVWCREGGWYCLTITNTYDFYVAGGWYCLTIINTYDFYVARGYYCFGNN